MTINGIGLILNQPESPLGFKEDRKNRRVPVAAVRMRKHRYDMLAEATATRHIDPASGPEAPLRTRFRGPNRTSIWQHIESNLTDIYEKSNPQEFDEGFAVSHEVLAKLLKILYSVCESTSVYPHISPDGDNGVAAVWYAGALSLEIVVDSDADAFAIVKAGAKMQSIDLSEGRSRALRATKGHLGKITAHVKAGNPQWRSLVR